MTPQEQLELLKGLSPSAAKTFEDRRSRYGFGGAGWTTQTSRGTGEERYWQKYGKTISEVLSRTKRQVSEDEFEIADLQRAYENAKTEGHSSTQQKLESLQNAMDAFGTRWDTSSSLISSNIQSLLSDGSFNAQDILQDNPGQANNQGGRMGWYDSATGQETSYGVGTYGIIPGSQGESQQSNTSTTGTNTETTTGDTTENTSTNDINNLYNQFFGRDASQPEIDNWSKERLIDLESFLHKEYKKLSGKHYDGTPYTGEPVTPEPPVVEPPIVEPPGEQPGTQQATLTSPDGKSKVVVTVGSAEASQLMQGGWILGDSGTTEVSLDDAIAGIGETSTTETPTTDTPTTDTPTPETPSTETPTDISALTEGKAYKFAGDPKVYQFKDGRLQHIKDEAAFKELYGGLPEVGTNYTVIDDEYKSYAEEDVEFDTTQEQEEQQRLQDARDMIEQAIQSGEITSEVGELWKLILENYPEDMEVNPEEILNTMDKISEETIDPYFDNLVKMAKADFEGAINYMQTQHDLEVEQLGAEGIKRIREAQGNLESSGMTFSGKAVEQLGQESAYPTLEAQQQAQQQAEQEAQQEGLQPGTPEYDEVVKKKVDIRKPGQQPGQEYLGYVDGKIQTFPTEEAAQQAGATGIEPNFNRSIGLPQPQKGVPRDQSRQPGQDYGEGIRGIGQTEGSIPQYNRMMATSSDARRAQAIQQLGSGIEQQLGSGMGGLTLPSYNVLGGITGELDIQREGAKGGYLRQLIGTKSAKTESLTNI